MERWCEVVGNRRAGDQMVEVRGAIVHHKLRQATSIQTRGAKVTVRCISGPVEAAELVAAGALAAELLAARLLAARLLPAVGRAAPRRGRRVGCRVWQ